MLFNRTALIFISCGFLVSCNGSSNESAQTSTEQPVEGSELSIVLGTGIEVTAESLTCVYRQSFGSNNDLSLQLQYLSSPNAVAFALYIDNPIPAVPFTAAAGQQGSFEFEVFVENSGFRDVLTDGEVVVSLNDLPSPSALADNDEIDLTGNIALNEFTLPKTFGAAEMDITVTTGNIDISCEALFQLSEVLN